MRLNGGFTKHPSNVMRDLKTPCDVEAGKNKRKEEAMSAY